MHVWAFFFFPARLQRRFSFMVEPPDFSAHSATRSVFCCGENVPRKKNNSGKIQPKSCKLNTTRISNIFFCKVSWPKKLCRSECLVSAIVLYYARLTDKKSSVEMPQEPLSRLQPRHWIRSLDFDSVQGRGTLIGRVEILPVLFIEHEH